MHVMWERLRSFCTQGEFFTNNNLSLKKILIIFIMLPDLPIFDFSTIAEIAEIFSAINVPVGGLR